MDAFLFIFFMIGYLQKHIIWYNCDRERRKYHHKVEVNLLIDESEINDYLGEAKKLILDGKFRIALNSNRLTNLSLFDEYLINEESVKSILLNLKYMTFVRRFKINMRILIMNGYMFLERKLIWLKDSKKKVKWFHCILSLIK